MRMLFKQNKYVFAVLSLSIWLGTSAIVLPAPVMPTSVAIPKLSLQQVTERIYQHNPSLWKLRQEQKLAESRILQAGLGINPELTLGAEDFAGSAAFTPDRFTQFTLGLSQTLLMGNKLESRTVLAKLNQQLLYWEYRVQLQELGYKAYTLYARLLNLQEMQILLLEMLGMSQEMQRLLEQAVRAGKFAETVLLQSQLAIQEIKAEQSQLQIHSQTFASELAALWGAPEADFGQLTPDLTGTEPMAKLDTLIPKLVLHPRLARWQMEHQQRQAQSDAAQAQAVPDLNLTGGVRYHPPLDWAVVFSVGIPLPLANQNQGHIQETRLRQDMWQTEKNLEEIQMRGQLQRAYRKFQGQTELLHILQEEQRLAQAQQQAAVKGFEAGKIGYLEVLLAYQNIFRLRRQLVQSHGDRLLAQVEVLSFTQEFLPESVP